MGYSFAPEIPKRFS